MFDLKSEWKPFVLIIAVFLLVYFLPLGALGFDNPISEALNLLQWYAHEHVLFCLIPAFFIAGAIAVFISQNAVMKYLGANAKKILAYSVASVSGSVLAVCSCTILPLFAGIYRMGAGLGPATAFLYAGPAINVLAIILTARILGVQLGIARAVGAILFSVIIGLLMQLIFRNEKAEKIKARAEVKDNSPSRPLWQTAVYFATMTAILIFANWGKPDAVSGFWNLVYNLKWYFTAGAAGFLGFMLIYWFNISIWKVYLTAGLTAAAALFFSARPELPFTVAVLGLSLTLISSKNENNEWFSQSWGYAKQILPLLFLGVIAAGLLLGRPGHEGLIPSHWISSAVGGNSIWSVLFASIVGAFMYFATLTEVPILQGLIGQGMGQGPALALLLAGPALSLPNMLVIRSIMGTRKTIVFVVLVISMATISGMIYGNLV